MSPRDELDAIHSHLLADAKQQPEYANNQVSGLYGYSEGAEHALDVVRLKGYTKPRITSHPVSNIDELAAVIYQARWVDGINNAALVTDAALAKKILDEGYVKHRTITTIEELDALPDGSIVMTRYGQAVNIHRNHSILTDERFHFILSEDGDYATVLHEPKSDT